MIMPTDQRRKGLRRGAAAVELAVLAPFLVFLFLSTVDFGRIFYYSLTIENCARNGALYGCNAANSQMPYATIPQATIADGANLTPPLTTDNVKVTNGYDANSNRSVTVTVNYSFQTIVNYPGIPNVMNLVRTMEMRVAP